MINVLLAKTICYESLRSLSTTDLIATISFSRVTKELLFSCLLRSYLQNTSVQNYVVLLVHGLQNKVAKGGGGGSLVRVGMC